MNFGLLELCVAVLVGVFFGVCYSNTSVIPVFLASDCHNGVFDGLSCRPVQHFYRIGVGHRGVNSHQICDLDEMEVGAAKGKIFAVGNHYGVISEWLWRQRQFARREGVFGVFLHVEAVILAVRHHLGKAVQVITA